MKAQTGLKMVSSIASKAQVQQCTTEKNKVNNKSYFERHMCDKEPPLSMLLLLHLCAQMAICSLKTLEGDQKTANIMHGNQFYKLGMKF